MLNLPPDEVASTLAARSELGSQYDKALAESFVERVGEEIDKRVDARLAASGAAKRPKSSHGAAVGLALGSMGMGLVITAIALGAAGGFAGVLVVLIAWIAIAVVNISFNNSRS
ncbi:hypothetical protein [Rhizohabitans arisaemae]|uniref:hypothetical protein n=1 Tax=Rhizohabitans arisaemae TaxID=2720610 RepID=UPI0024B0ED5B|nr:hypothetical protein [Rhizohabitans arisaemae]